MSTSRWGVHIVGSTRARVQVRSAARFQVGQLLEQLCHNLELLPQHLSFSRIDRGLCHRVELLINGIRGVHDRVFQRRLLGMGGYIKVTLYVVQGLCLYAGRDSSRGEVIGRGNSDDMCEPCMLSSVARVSS